MKTNTKIYAGITASIVIFLLAGYDTVHAHILTEGFNNWVLQVFYVSSEATGLWQKIYYETLTDFTALGGDPVFHLAMIFLFLYLVVERHTEAVVYCFFATCAILLLTAVCKLLVDSPRPMFPEHTSFPSGHVIRAGIWCGIILFLNQTKVFHLSRYWCGVFISIPIIVGLTRLGLGYHWLSDALASFAICTTVFLMTAIVQRKISKGNSNLSEE